jgi:hypothetical protein
VATWPDCRHAVPSIAEIRQKIVSPLGRPCRVGRRPDGDTLSRRGTTLYLGGLIFWREREDQYKMKMGKEKREK